MLRTVVPLALLLLFAPSLATPLAAEPSFDCRTARTARELATCADATIAAADRELAAAWQNAIAPLDPATVKALRADQKKFLEDLEKSCARRSEFTRPLYQSSGVSPSAPPHSIGTNRG
jgi:uncharacterized protein